MDERDDRPEEDSSSFEVPDYDEPLRLGRQPGQVVTSYSMEECKIALECLLEHLPISISGRGMLKIIQKALPVDRSLVALQSFVSNKLRRVAPALLNTHYGGTTKLNEPQKHFMKKYLDVVPKNRRKSGTSPNDSTSSAPQLRKFFSSTPVRSNSESGQGTSKDSSDTTLDANATTSSTAIGEEERQGTSKDTSEDISIDENATTSSSGIEEDRQGTSKDTSEDISIDENATTSSTDVGEEERQGTSKDNSEDISINENATTSSIGIEEDSFEVSVRQGTSKDTSEDISIDENATTSSIGIGEDTFEVAAREDFVEKATGAFLSQADEADQMELTVSSEESYLLPPPDGFPLRARVSNVTMVHIFPEEKYEEKISNYFAKESEEGYTLYMKRKQPSIDDSLVVHTGGPDKAKDDEPESSIVKNDICSIIRDYKGLQKLEMNLSGKSLKVCQEIILNMNDGTKTTALLYTKKRKAGKKQPCADV